MSRLALLWRRPEHATPWTLRLGAFAAGLALWVALERLFDVGDVVTIALPTLAVVAAELWYQPTRAAASAQRRAEARAHATPATTPYGVALLDGEPQPIAVVFFIVPFAVNQVGLSLYRATDEDPLVLIAYGALLTGALGIALVRRARRGSAGS